MLLSELTSFAEQNRSKGRGEAFGFDAITTETYLRWAFTHRYLIVTYKDSDITGLGIVYPVNADGSQEALFHFNNGIQQDKEHLHDLCILDMISVDSESTKTLVNKFKTRYPHWESCKKWALRMGDLKEITNQYINLL